MRSARRRSTSIDAETARDVLAEVNRLAREDLAASYIDGRPQPAASSTRRRTPRRCRSRSRSRTRRSWRPSSGASTCPAALGGTLAPRALWWAIAEQVLGANAPIWMYSSGPSFAHVVHVEGTEEQKKWAQLFVDKQWGSTMVLTEPDAGSDVGAGRTRAIPQPDGSWHIEGVKRFITSGEHDLSDNIIHYVLARPVGVEGVGGPGTKGLSLFIVPKFHFDGETGELGERNGVYATNVEHKMGLKVSNTCEMTFGEHGTPAKGWLLGEVHQGIRQMFMIIEYARMMVGTKAIATLSTGYLNALEYAKNRVQGADLVQNTNKAAPRVTITHHPDVRRSLMLQKSYAEGLRALVIYTATWQDKVAIARGGRRHRGGQGRQPGQRPAAAAGQGRRLGAGVRAARPRVAADLRRLRLPAGLPARAVRPGRQDRHPVRGHHRDPEPRPDLPQDRQGPGSGAGRARHRDAGVHRERGRQRPAQGGAAVARQGARRAAGHPRHRRWAGCTAVQGGDTRELYKVGPDLPPGAARPGRRDGRLAAAAPGRGRAEGAGRRGSAPPTRPSTRARSPRPGSSPARCCPGSARTAGSSRTPRSTSWTCPRRRSDLHALLNDEGRRTTTSAGLSCSCRGRCAARSAASSPARCRDQGPSARCTASPAVFSSTTLPSSSSYGLSRSGHIGHGGVVADHQHRAAPLRNGPEQVDDLGAAAVVEPLLVVHLGRAATSGAAWASAIETPCQVCRVRAAGEQSTRSGRSRSSASQEPAASASASPFVGQPALEVGQLTGRLGLGVPQQDEGPCGHGHQLA